MQEDESTGLVGWQLWAFALLLSSCILAAAPSATANPGVYPDFGSREELLFYLAIANLPIDLFCFSTTILFMCSNYARGVGNIWRNRYWFLASVIIGSFVIATLGAVIDFYSFYTEEYGGYSLSWGEEDPIYASPSLYLALSSIFLSVFFATVVIVRAKWIVGLYVATVFTALNFMAWILIVGTSDSMFLAPVILLSSAFGLFALVSLYLLGRWHRRNVSRGVTAADLAGA